MLTPLINPADIKFDKPGFDVKAIKFDYVTGIYNLFIYPDPIPNPGLDGRVEGDWYDYTKNGEPRVAAYDLPKIINSGLDWDKPIYTVPESELGLHVLAKDWRLHETDNPLINVCFKYTDGVCRSGIRNQDGSYVSGFGSEYRIANSLPRISAFFSFKEGKFGEPALNLQDAGWCGAPYTIELVQQGDKIIEAKVHENG